MMNILKKGLSINVNKTTLILVLIFLISTTSVFAQCSGSSTYSTVEGETITLTAPEFTTLDTNSWRVTAGDLYGYTQSSIFSNANGCSVDFSLSLNGTFTVAVDNAAGSGTTTMTVDVLDILNARGFGHECYEIDTSNCGDMYVYGDIQAVGSIDAADIFSYGLIHTFTSLSVGDYSNPGVFINKTLVKLPKTTVSGDLNLLGVLSSSSGLLRLGNTQILGFLNVTGSTYLYRVNTLSNNGNPITIYADVDTLGELFVNDRINAGNATVFGSLLVSGGSATADNLIVHQSAVVDGNVRVTGSEDRLMGPVNLRAACDSVSPRMYQEGNDFVIEIGDANNKCASGDACLTSADCQSGTCNSGVCQ